MGMNSLRAWSVRYVGHNEDMLRDLRAKWKVFRRQPKNERLAKVLEMRFALDGGEPHTLSEIALVLGVPYGTVCGMTAVAVRELFKTPLPVAVEAPVVVPAHRSLDDKYTPWHKLPNHSREQVQTVLLDLLDDARKRGENASRRKLHEVAAGFWSAADGLEAALRLLEVDP